MTTLIITNEEPPPPPSRGRTAIEWKQVDGQLRRAKNKWATLGPWRSNGAASAYAKKIADDQTPLDAACYEVTSRRHTLDDGTTGSILWLRYVGI